MTVKNFVQVCAKLSSHPSTLDKVDILKRYAEDPLLMQLLAGEIPVTGVAEQMVLTACYVMNKDFTREKAEQLVAQSGDYGCVVEHARLGMYGGIYMPRSPSELMTLKRLQEFIDTLCSVQGQIDKTVYLKNLFLKLSPDECYVVTNLLLGKMKTGVSDGNIRRAISEHFKTPDEKIRLASASMTYSQIIQRLKSGQSLDELQYGVPFFPQLAQRGGVIGISGRYEFKYDGLRCLGHIFLEGDKKTVELFSRKGESLTEQFPELVQELLSFPPCIVDGEIVAIGKGEKALPFQNVLQRSRRKYGIEQYVDLVPVSYFLFDLVKTREGTLINFPFKERRRVLEELYALYAPCQKIHLAEGIYVEGTDIDEDEKQKILSFLNKSISLGHEGFVIKDLDSFYTIGKRTMDWLKLKQTLPTLDLVITGAQYGEGKKSGYFSSYEVSALDLEDLSDTHAHDKLKVVGWVGTGVQDHEMILLTTRLKALVESQDGRLVRVKPEIVLEILAEEVQASGKYISGIALRFPRVVAIRDDKRVEEISSLRSIKMLTARGIDMGSVSSLQK